MNSVTSHYKDTRGKIHVLTHMDFASEQKSFKELFDYAAHLWMSYANILYVDVVCEGQKYTIHHVS